MIYREQSDENDIGTHGHPWMCLLTHAVKVLFRDATDLQYQILLISMISHIVIAVDHEVSQGGYMAWSSELVKWQQVHAVIEIYY